MINKQISLNERCVCVNKRGKIFNKINIADKIYNVKKIWDYYACRYEHKNIINIDNNNGIDFDGNV